jgi:hypothetical protein
MKKKTLKKADPILHSWEGKRKKEIEQRLPLSVRSSRSERVACRDP